MRTDDALIRTAAGAIGFVAVAAAAAGAGLLAASLVAVAVLLVLVSLARPLMTPSVLLVGDPDGADGRRLGGMTRALEDAGFAVTTCEGPARRTCPVVQGDPCPVKCRASAVVVAHPATYSGPVPDCGRVLGLPELRIEDRSYLEPFVDRKAGSACVGGSRGPEVAVGTLMALLQPPLRTEAAIPGTGPDLSWFTQASVSARPTGWDGRPKGWARTHFARPASDF
jgi:hypothetical protein